MPPVAKATALKIDEITEFSLVPRSMGRPANEHAQISITKAKEGGAQVPNEATPTDIQKAVDEAVAKARAEDAARIAKAEAESARLAEIVKTSAEEIAKANEEKAFAKCEQRLEKQGISKALAGDFRAFEKSSPEASGRIEAEMARLVKVASNVSALTKSIGSVTAQEGSAQSKLEKAIADLRKADPSLSESAAYDKAFDSLSMVEKAAVLGDK